MRGLADQKNSEAVPIGPCGSIVFRLRAALQGVPHSGKPAEHSVKYLERGTHLRFQITEQGFLPRWRHLDF